MTNSDWITLCSTIATFLGVAVSIVALWLQLKKLNQQLILQHFADYTKRYQEIITRFPEDINNMAFKLKDREDYDKTMRAMRTYFDLCFEEWYLHKRGLIDSRIWEIWNGGIKTALSKPAFVQAWDIIQRDTEFGQEFKNFLSSLRSFKESVDIVQSTLPPTTATNQIISK